VVDDERRALHEAYRLLEAVQGDAPDVALEATQRGLVTARREGWTRVRLLLELITCVHGLVHGPSDRTDAALEAVLAGASREGATAVQAAALGVRAVLAGTRGQTAGLLADAAEAVRLLDDDTQPPPERSTGYVVVAAAYNRLRLWELVDDLYQRAELCDRDDLFAAQRAAIAVDRVILRVEWALALTEIGRDDAAAEQRRRAAEVVQAARHTPMPNLWRRVAEAGGELVEVLEDPAPRTRQAHVEAIAADLRGMGDLELLPLLEASWALALHRAGHRRQARRAALALGLGTSTSSGGSTVPSWVRAHVLRGRRPTLAVRAQAEHADRLAAARWEARLAVLDAATAQIDVARRRAELERLLAEATTDALTGLSNRRVFDSWLSVGQAGTAACDGLLLVDLDDFKEVNDRYGHGVGDDVLRVVGELVRAVLQPGDVGVRLGGDEFALLVADASDDTAMQERASAVRELVAAYDWSALMPERALRVSTGAGVGSPLGTVTRTELYRLADDDLYASKRERALR
jgi:diguanylate cyclase (GGDEF)-like protein